MRVILESSLDMAKKLRITSVAEGVETQADWEMYFVSSAAISRRAISLPGRWRLLTSPAGRRSGRRLNRLRAYGFGAMPLIRLSLPHRSILQSF